MRRLQSQSRPLHIPWSVPGEVSPVNPCSTHTLSLSTVSPDPCRGSFLCDFRDLSPPCTPARVYLEGQPLQRWALRPLTGGDAGVYRDKGCKESQGKGRSSQQTKGRGVQHWGHGSGLCVRFRTCSKNPCLLGYEILKSLKIQPPYSPAVLLLVIYPKKR